MKFGGLRTLRQKLLAVVLLTTLVAVLVALIAIVGYHLRADHKNLIADLTTQSELLGHMTAPALAFEDKQLANQNLSLLRFRPTVRAAAIYRAHGGIFSSYAAQGVKYTFPEKAAADSVRIEGRQLILFKDIVSDGESLGTVFLVADYELAGKIMDYLGIATLAMLLAMLIAFLMLVRIQKVVTGPILAITEVAREVVALQDYSRRAERMSEDEVGLLVGSFNDMLSEIERRTQKLESSNREIAREASERARAQQEVMRLNEELEHRVHERTAQLEVTNQALALAKGAAENANQAKSTFLSSMSHELRTPLNAILGFAQLLRSESIPSSPLQKKEFADHILKAGRHLLALINEVLDLAKVESGTLTLSLEPVSLAEVIRECHEMIDPLAAKANIRLIFPENVDSHVLADRTRIKQVLLNLFSNAVKYNRVGGSIIVGCHAAGAERIRLTVQDTGAGLSPEQIAQLFQPFNRLGQEAQSEEGTGIGLVVTKRLLELMDGQIGVHSTVGTGSTFWIDLKATAPAQYALGSNITKLIPAAKPKASKYSKYDLLYVEDNPANLKLIQQIIELR